MKDSTGKDWSLGFDTFDRYGYCCTDGLGFNATNSAINTDVIKSANNGVSISSTYDSLIDKIEKLEEAFKGIVSNAGEDNVTGINTARKWHFRAKDMVLRFGH